MAKKDVKIWFITWPDGKMFERTQTSIGETQSIALAVHSWLPKDWFPGLNLAQCWSLRTELWAAMQRAGFKVHELDVASVDGVSL